MWVEEKHENYITAVKKMRNTSGYQDENERQWKNSVSRNTNISSKKRAKEVSRFSRAKQRQANVQKSVLHVQSCCFFFC